MKRFIPLLLALALAATACQGNVFSLSAGTCFNDPDGTEVSDVEIVDCTEPHDNEVYATFDIPGSEFPGQFAVQTDAQEGCIDRFETYVGSDYWVSALDVSSLSPTSGSWDNGDREVICFLYDLEGAKLNATMKNSGV